MYKERDLPIVSPSWEYLSEGRYGQLRLAPSVCVCVYSMFAVLLAWVIICAVLLTVYYCTVLYCSYDKQYEHTGVSKF